MPSQSNSTEAASGTVSKTRVGRNASNAGKPSKKAKLAALKAQVQEGTFQVDSSRVAERLLTRGLR